MHYVYYRNGVFRLHSDFQFEYINMLFTLTAVKELTYGGIDQVGLMEWKKLIEHVQSKFEDKYLFEDELYEESVDEFIVSAGGYDDESSS